MIHYHGIAGLDGLCLAALKGRHLLYSFAHSRSLWERARELAASYCIDSGAFTAWSNGEPLDLDGYAAFANDALSDPSLDFIVAPDVIDGGWEANATRQGTWFYQRARLPRRVCCPVWHTSEEPEALKHLGYLARSYDRLAIGSSGAHPIKSAQWWRVLRKAWEILAPGGRPLLPVHGFRMLDPEVVQAFPWASCDSTTASRNVRKGQRARFGPIGANASKRTRLVAYCEHLESFLPPLRYEARPVQAGIFEEAG